MRCLAAYLYAAAGQGESTTDLSWDGQTSIFENGTAAGRGRAVRRGPAADHRRRRPRPAPPGAGPAGHLRGQPPRWRHRRALPDGRVHPRPAGRRPRAAADRGAVPVRAGRSRPAGPGLLRGLQHPGRRPGPAAARDQHRQGGDRRLRRSGLHPRADRRRPGDGPARPAADQHPRRSPCPVSPPATSTKANAWALMRALGITAAELDIRPAARQMLADLEHPFGRGEEVYDVTFENVQAGLRTDYLFRLANHHHGIVLGTGDLSELALGWSTYGVGDQMSHYNVNAGVPKTLIQHLIRWVGRAGRLLRPGRRDPAVDPGHRDLARADPGEGGRGAAEHREVDRPVRAAGLQPVLHAAVRLPAVQDRVPGPARLGRRRRGQLAGRASRRSGAAPTTCRRSGSG